MHALTLWRPQLTTASGKHKAPLLRPTFLPCDFHAEWDLAIQAHHNLLLEGTPSDTNEMLVVMEPYLREPVQAYMPTTGVSVPELSEGTLVLLEVARLDAKQQTQLLRWLDQFNERSVQVVSTSSEPLFSLVQAEAFLADLYYKLNIVRIDLIGAGERTS